MNDRINSKYVFIVLIVLAAFFFAAGASNSGKLQSNGRFQLVVRHNDSTDVFVIDTATGQVWTNKYTSPDGAKENLYKAKLAQE